MAIPATTGQLRTRISDMQIGDYIIARYKATSGTVYGAITEIGTSTAAELPFAPISAPDGSFYLIKADKGLLIADRNVHLMTSMTTDANNAFYNLVYTTDAGINMTGATAVTAPLVYSKVINGNTVVVSASASYAVNYEALRCWGATGGADGDRWLSDGNIAGNWVKIDLGVSTPINAYSMQCGLMATASPKEWKVYGSDDNTNWTQVDYVNNHPSGTAVATYYLANIENYRYFKWELINNNGYTGAYKYDIGNITMFKNEIGVPGILRVIGGGIGYANKYGLKSDTFNTLYGAWPTNNEWDKYIVNSDLDGKITPGDDNVWHYSNKESWTQGFWCDINSATAYGRVIRGASPINRIYWGDSSSSSSVFGYRPVLDYQEVI